MSAKLWQYFENVLLSELVNLDYITAWKTIEKFIASVERQVLET